MTGRGLVIACSAGATVIALALAGVMDLGDGTEGSPPSPPSHRTRDAAAVGEDTPLLRQGITAVAPDTWDERIEPGAEWDGPGWLVKAHFRVRPAGAAEEGDFTCGHPVSLWADGTLVATSDPPGLRLPATAREAVFKAIGYRPVALPVPAAAAGSVDFGNVVFEPDAAVRVHLADAPVDGGEVRFVVGKALAVPYAERMATLRDGSAEVQLPAPSGEDLQVSALTVSDPAHNRYFATGCQTIRLRSGETGVVVLRPLPGGRVTVEVQGPSAALSSHLTVLLWDRSKPRLDRNYQPPRSALDARGRTTFCVPEQPCEFDVERDRGMTLLAACDGSGGVQMTTSQLTDNRIPAGLGDAAEVLVLPGSERIGFLMEQIDSWQQVTCWFTLRHGMGELLVEPRGHWTTVRVQPECIVHVFLDGPEANIPATGPGSITMAGQVQGPGECRVFVADGTRAVRVVSPQGTLTFTPDQVEIVVR